MNLVFLILQKKNLNCLWDWKEIQCTRTRPKLSNLFHWMLSVLYGSRLNVFYACSSMYKFSTSFDYFRQSSWIKFRQSNFIANRWTYLIFLCGIHFVNQQRYFFALRKSLLSNGFVESLSVQNLLCQWLAFFMWKTCFHLTEFKKINYHLCENRWKISCWKTNVAARWTTMHQGKNYSKFINH